jgi:hypothetical protein
MPKVSWLFLCVLLFIIRSIEADVSAQCTSEGKALANGTDLIAPSGGCTVDVSVSTKCSFDFATISSNYSQACQKSGGHFYEETITWDCTLGPYNVSFQYLNQPACLGASCSAAEAEEIYVNTLAPSSEEIFAEQGLTCTFTIDTAAEDSDPGTEENKSPESASPKWFTTSFPLVALSIVLGSIFV